MRSDPLAGEKKARDGESDLPPADGVGTNPPDLEAAWYERLQQIPQMPIRPCGVLRGREDARNRYQVQDSSDNRQFCAGKQSGFALQPEISHRYRQQGAQIGGYRRVAGGGEAADLNPTGASFMTKGLHLQQKYVTYTRMPRLVLDLQPTCRFTRQGSQREMKSD